MNKAIIEIRNKILIFISKEIFMDKQWVEKKTAEHKKKIEAEKAKLYEKVNACELIPEKAKKKLLKEIDRYEEEPYGTIHTFMIFLLKSMRDVDVEIELFDDFINKELKLDNYIMLHRYRYFGHLHKKQSTFRCSVLQFCLFIINVYL